MKKSFFWPFLFRLFGFRRGLEVLFLCSLLGLGACGELRPRPATFDPQAYTPIEYQNLLAPRQAGLHAGEKIRVKAYFWQYLDYEPAMIRNYLTLLRYPIQWYRLRWFAIYRTDDLTGYYDLAAITPELAEHYDLQRLDPVLIYGELSQLGMGLFLQVFHMEKIVED
ncbi:MAG: hypothetical protein ACOZFS_13785 [Thermodesulfobacteriota bacterium]